MIGIDSRGGIHPGGQGAASTPTETKSTDREMKRLLMTSAICLAAISTTAHAQNTVTTTCTQQGNSQSCTTTYGVRDSQAYIDCVH
jgi:hypothetical protein